MPSRRITGALHRGTVIFGSLRRVAAVAFVASEMEVGFFYLRDTSIQPTALKQSVLYQEDKVTTYES
jgi:hypothetical protein